MGGIGSGNRPHSVVEKRWMQIDRAWKNTDLILAGKENTLKPFQKKASLDIALRTLPQKIEGEGFASNNVTQIFTGVDEGRITSLRDRIRQALGSTESV